jgi:polysaccharide export outer membrane protein
MKAIFILWLLFIVGFTACIPNKKLVYLQNKTQALADTNVVKDYTRTKYRIQINDILSIQLRTIDQQAVALFNNNVGGQNMQVGALGGGDVFYLNGYTVDDSGRVELPMIGKLQLQGLTLAEAKGVIEGEAKQYFNNFYVDIKFGGIRYSILGEVVRPGKFVILQEQFNIFEAIANSGDLTIVANRNEVEIIRQFPEGPQVFSVDLTDRSILYSPFYFIKPNDIIYVKPLKVKSLGTGTTGVSTFQTVVSILSAALLIFSITRIR